MIANFSQHAVFVPQKHALIGSNATKISWNYIQFLKNHDKDNYWAIISQATY